MAPYEYENACYAGIGFGLGDGVGYAFPEPLLFADAPGAPEVVAASPIEELISPWGQFGPPAYSLNDLDHCNRRLSNGLIRAILRDPTAGSAVRALKLGVLQGGFKLTPAIHEAPDDPNAPTPDPNAPAPDPADPKTTPDPDVELAAEICAFVERCHLRCERPPLLVLDELLDAMTHRHKVAEIVMEPGDGLDTGRYVLRRLAVKPHWSYRFVVNAQMELDALEVMTDDRAAENRWVRIHPEKFVIFAWDTKDGDPRGNSILDPVLEPWELKRSFVPAWKKGIDQFGTPTLKGTTAEGAQPIPQTNSDGSINRAVPPISAQVAYSQGIAKFFGSGKQIVTPFGYDLNVIESQRDGTANVVAMERCDADMTRAILLQTRATREAKFGSKADSETGADLLGTYVLFLRAWACELWLDQVVWRMVEVNWGKEVADRLCPNLSLGGVNARDFATWATAVSVLFQAGYFTDSMLPATDVFMGFTPRQPGEPRVGPQATTAAGLAGSKPPPTGTPKPNEGGAPP